MERPKLNKNQMITLLQRLGEKLDQPKVKAKFNGPVRVLLLGGAYLMLLLGLRRATGDLDCILLDLDSMIWKKQPDDTKALVLAIKEVAKKEGIKSPTWMNDDCSPFILEMTDNHLPPMELWQTFGFLEIYIPPIEFIFVLKLLAGRAQDEDDILALQQRLKVWKRSQALSLISSYIPNQEYYEYYDLSHTLDRFFE